MALALVARDATTKAANLIELSRQVYAAIDPEVIRRGVIDKLSEG